jgi:rubrerythrin
MATFRPYLDSTTQTLTEEFFSRLVSSPRGRAFHLRLMTDHEEADEGLVFDSLLARIDDPSLHKMVERHSTDEKRHARMLRECAERTGAPPEPVPEELRVVHRMERKIGFGEAFFVTHQMGVMEAYVLLGVLEERAVQQYPVYARAVAHVDPASAAAIASIARDEQRHVLYSRAISRRYAPDARTLGQVVDRFRRAEEIAFAEYNQAYWRIAAELGLVATGHEPSEEAPRV